MKPDGTPIVHEPTPISMFRRPRNTYRCFYPLTKGNWSKTPFLNACIPYFYPVMETRSIDSVHNPLVKKVLLLKEKSRERKKTGLFVVEGLRELELALKGGYGLQTLLYRQDLIRPSDIPSLAALTDIDRVQLNAQVYEKLAHRGTTEGIIGIMHGRDHGLDHIHFSRKEPLILVAEAPEKPGNIGALLRTADAAALDAVLIADPKSDLYNPNSSRSSVGAVFTTQIGMGTSGEIIQFLKERNIKIYCASLEASKSYSECDLRGATALVMGTEATGLTPQWLENSDQNLIIPMHG